FLDFPDTEDVYDMPAVALPAEQSVQHFDPLQPPVDISAPRGPPTEMRFEEEEYDFGQILQGSENPHVFKFKNTGKVPLIISMAQGSCGCTVPFYSREPIMPGKESEIHVVYKPGKQEGKQAKTVTITANTVPMQTILRIKAEVLVNDSAVVPSLFAVDQEQQE